MSGSTGPSDSAPVAASDPSGAIQVSIAEYTTLSAEIASRFESQRLSFTLTITLLGAAIAALTSRDFPLNAQARAAILLAVPIMVTSGAAIFFDNELMIYRIAARIETAIRPRLVALTGEAGLLASPLPANTVDRFAGIAFSFARWILFLAGPVAASVALSRRPDLFPVAGPIEATAFYLGIALEVLLAIGMATSVSLQWTWTARAGTLTSAART